MPNPQLPRFPMLCGIAMADTATANGQNRPIFEVDLGVNFDL